MRDIRNGLWPIALGVVFMLASTHTYGEEVYPEKEWVWGCQIRGRSVSGECVMWKFTKVGETENDVDTDEPRVLGFEPGNMPISRDGMPIWSRIRAPMWMKPGEVRIYEAATCKCSR